MDRTLPGCGVAGGGGFSKCRNRAQRGALLGKPTDQLPAGVVGHEDVADFSHEPDRIAAVVHDDILRLRLRRAWVRSHRMTSAASRCPRGRPLYVGHVAASSLSALSM